MSNLGILIVFYGQSHRPHPDVHEVHPRLELWP